MHFKKHENVSMFHQILQLFQHLLLDVAYLLEKWLVQMKQAMITLQRMAEHRLNNVYNYQCLIWILTFPLIPFPSYFLYSQFLTGFYAKSSIIRQHFEKIMPSLPFYGMIKSQHLCKGMAWLPFQKCGQRESKTDKLFIP